MLPIFFIFTNPRSSGSPFKSKSKAKSSLSCYNGSQTSPRRQATTSRGSKSAAVTLNRSVSLHVSHSSPTYVNVNAPPGLAHGKLLTP